MKNIIYDEGNRQIQVTYANVYEDWFYVVLKIYNNSGEETTFRLDDTGKYVYRSRVNGIYEFRGAYPWKSSDYYDIPSGYFQEIQLRFSATTISEGDEFNIKCSFYKPVVLMGFIFKYKEGNWIVEASLSGEGGWKREYTNEVSFAPPKSENKKEETNPLKELDALIGLQSVKEEVKTLANFVKIQKLRESKGMASSSISYHCVFTGNPGTGKTTVARIIAEIYKSLGILKKGHLVETDRSGLVGEYIGHTAVKTNAIIDSALDGVLFIDEAYALAPQEKGRDFGQEAISTLLKRMEDDRERLAVIIAGYSKEMKEFIKSNSGLKSRFMRYIDFPDYSPSELLEIFRSMANSGGYKATQQAEIELEKALEEKTNSGDRDFGNGRYVRNVFEEAIKAQANRLAAMQNITDEELTTIVEQDILQGVLKASESIQ